VEEKMMNYVRCIDAPDDPKGLYEALGKVFTVPTIEALWDQNMLGVFFDENTTESGDNLSPKIYFDVHGVPKLIKTWSSAREIYLAWNDKKELIGVCIEFGGSVVAAGQVIAHLRAAGVKAFVFLDQESIAINVEDYTGPVHTQLSRVYYDPRWRVAHPEIMAQLQGYAE
jgi:hypothetical protein